MSTPTYIPQPPSRFNQSIPLTYFERHVLLPGGFHSGPSLDPMGSQTISNPSGIIGFARVCGTVCYGSMGSGVILSPGSNGNAGTAQRGYEGLPRSRSDGVHAEKHKIWRDSLGLHFRRTAGLGQDAAHCRRYYTDTAMRYSHT
jgi:hypothetical protein